MLDEKRWNQLVERLSGNTPPGGAFSRILAAYSEPHRHYHTVSHIEHCLKEFDEVRESCEAPDQVEFALWLHDAVYDPHASDNEELSAELAGEILSQPGCPEMTAIKIRELILITRHSAPPATHDARVIVDVDLSILGQPPGIFDIYEQNIRAEYSWVGDESYRIGRSKILRGFLGKASIYATEGFVKRYEQQARTNISRALAALAH